MKTRLIIGLLILPFLYAGCDSAGDHTEIYYGDNITMSAIYELRSTCENVNPGERVEIQDVDDPVTATIGRDDQVCRIEIQMPEALSE